MDERLTAEEKRLLRAVIDGQEEERSRLARELHDGLGQQLAAMQYLLEGAVREGGEASLQERLEAALEILGDIVHLKNGICYSLMPQALAEGGLIAAVRDLAGRMRKFGVIRVVVAVGRDFRTLPQALEIDLFRVVQEL